jgi:hypothetical protein
MTRRRDLVQNFSNMGLPTRKTAVTLQRNRKQDRPDMPTNTITLPVLPAAAIEGARVISLGLLLLVLVLIITPITGVALAPAS